MGVENGRIDRVREVVTNPSRAKQKLAFNIMQGKYAFFNNYIIIPQKIRGTAKNEVYTSFLSSTEEMCNECRITGLCGTW